MEREYKTYKWLDTVSSSIARYLNVQWPPGLNRNSRNTLELMNALSRYYLSYYNAPNEQIELINKFLNEIENKHLINNNIQKQDIINIFNSVTSYQIDLIIQNEGILQLRVNISGRWVWFNYGTFSFRLPLSRYELLREDGVNSNESIATVLLRYSGLFPISGNFWSIPPEAYLYFSENILEYAPSMNDIEEFPIVECFASPLNFNLPTYCSLFPDVDAPFGSIGNFFEVYNSFEPGLYIVNPPYTERLIDATAAVVLHLLEKEGQWVIILMLPTWVDLDPFKQLKRSRHTKFIINLEKNSFEVYHALNDTRIRGPFEITVLVMSTIPLTITEEQIRELFQ